MHLLGRFVKREGWQDLPKRDDHPSLHIFIGIYLINPAEIPRFAIIEVGVEEGIHGCSDDGGAFADMVIKEDDGGDEG
jgi:hypothetical protein